MMGGSVTPSDPTETPAPEAPPADAPPVEVPPEVNDDKPADPA